MSQMNERGARSERGSALWGTGGRGGDRSSVLWGKGGRGLLVTCVAVFALTAPMAAMATSSGPAPAAGSSFIAPTLLNAKGLVDVVISYSPSFDASGQGASLLDGRLRGMGVFQNMKRLGLINGYEGFVPAAQLKKLADVPGLSVTPNANVKLSGSTSSQLWPFESGNSKLWAGDALLYNGKLPAIAVVDSGIQNRPDFDTRVIASVNLSTIDGNTSMDDQRGHGTFVGSIAAGNGAGLAGAAPTAPLVSVKVMDSNGMAKTSDVITACQWILDNKSKYNIRVANFSLHSSYSTNFYRDPLDQAVEKLWFNGVTVVAAAGNYGSAAGPSGVLYAPGNDPFVITVGALDMGSSPRANDDTVAPWSAYGYTRDGFYKPEVSAPGRYIVGAIPSGSTIAAAKASSLVGSDRIELSGTSFAAPVVAGTAAQMLARHPNWSPDQIKGALMRTARAVRNDGNPLAAGLGEITADRAAFATWAPNPNLTLDRYVSSSSLLGGLAFDAQSWASSAKASTSWNSMSWTDQSWSDQSWSDQSWSTMSWTDMSWTDMSWTDMSWTDMSWTDMSWTDMSNEDAAEGDALPDTPGIVASPTDVLDAAADPDHVAVNELPADLVPAPTALLP